MPIHHTKLMMSKPQPIGIVTPQTPIPLKRRKAVATSRSCITENAMAKPTNQPRGVFRWRTIWLIVSGAVPKPGPGGMGRSCSVCLVSWGAGLATPDLRVVVLHRGEVRRPGARVQLRQQSVVPWRGLELRHAALGVVHVSEDDGLGGTGLLARRLDLAVLDLATLVLRVDASLVDALHAVGALLHDAPASH